MSLFDDASLVITPNGFKAGKLYAVKGSDLDVVRATSATRVNANGLIETVGANVPRIDYSGGGCPSVLVEPQRTNSLLNSTTVANQTIITGAVAYTLSFYGTGTITLSGTHSATVVGTGTTRKTYTFTPTAGILILTVSGTCTNGQLEAGSYATSYIPTTSAIVTRNADVISKTGISDLIGQTEGTLFIDTYIDNISSQTNDPVLCYIKGTSAEAYIQIFDNGKVDANFYDGTNVTCNISVSIGLTNGRHKFAFAYKTNDFTLFLDGVEIGTDTNGSASASLNQFGLQYYDNSFIGKQYVNSSQLYKKRLTNAELAELTTI